MEQIIFYILAAVTVIATLFAITEKHAVHAIVYLVTSFFALAVIFFLLGAPLVAVFEVIIYAGAIMVLFLFVIMMLDLGHPEKAIRPGGRDWWPALLLCSVTMGAALALFAAHPPVVPAGASFGIRDFAATLFQKYGIAVEVISMQLLFALVGALYLGRRR
ncbi:MAG: NADH-quinone oxidoreductase subunit J [Geobacteraceae bacterium]|nr:NADH-quinone oxidoreductase subunit J [Geobacteraceae bacterium]